MVSDHVRVLPSSPDTDGKDTLILPPMWTEDGTENGKLAIGLTVAVLDVKVNFLPLTSVASAISFTAMVLFVLIDSEPPPVPTVPVAYWV